MSVDGRAMTTCQTMETHEHMFPGRGRLAFSLLSISRPNPELKMFQHCWSVLLRFDLRFGVFLLLLYLSFLFIEPAGVQNGACKGGGIGFGCSPLGFVGFG